jgi:hypothetical protein
MHQTNVMCNENVLTEKQIMHRVNNYLFNDVEVGKSR